MSLQRTEQRRLGCWTRGSVKSGLYSVQKTDTYQTYAITLSRPAEGSAVVQVSCPKCRRQVDVSVACQRETRGGQLGRMAVGVAGLIIFGLALATNISIGWDTPSWTLPGVPLGFLLALCGFGFGAAYDGISVDRKSFHKIFPAKTSQPRQKQRPEVRRLTGARRGIGLVMACVGILALVAVIPLLVLTFIGVGNPTLLKLALGETFLASVLLIGGAGVDGQTAFAAVVCALAVLVVTIPLFLVGLTAVGWGGILLVLLLFVVAQTLSAISRRRQQD
ncbi:hypothetical protein [Fodinicola acaciae]|uniref:hypothetical protein n=1 Tax=Fodinicola acaciae TaxID=2681555 RepID=UPI0013D5229A|nr:hypothetical protein [Fodinicola acaciae]